MRHPATKALKTMLARSAFRSGAIAPSPPSVMPIRMPITRLPVYTGSRMKMKSLVCYIDAVRLEEKRPEQQLYMVNRF